ncbi:DNA-binding transcriptional regulator, CsgD family [Roseivivax marinus]|uniref:autoinducer binding domain-containing protein n=1 Tax=Roseivivax marinus TaxID=1379903 RepID=UPI0008D550F6|nr:LuxR C-terminal-related transcriptional regulator [Roseivivax marinus]SEK35947.1 DNA-binding transcriptional regulator, CsgD family [Roseivivax marinus]
MTTRFARLLIDTADTLSHARNGEVAWLRIEAIVSRIGGEAVNAGAFLPVTRQIAWTRSSMAPEWLEEYAHEELYEIDPLLAAAIAGTPPPFYSVRDEDRHATGDLKRLHAGMMRYNYNFMLTQAWRDGDVSTCIAIATRDDPAHLFGPGTQRALSAVAAMMSLALSPSGPEAPGARTFGTHWRRLTRAEAEVLSRLAEGRTEAQVADDMKLSEAEIMAVLSGARTKMDSSSTDQALALAMARGLLSI